MNPLFFIFNTIKIIALAISSSIVLVNHLKIYKKHRLLNRKPFSCSQCFAGWMAGLLWILNLTLSLEALAWAEIPFGMCLSMVLSVPALNAFKNSVNKQTF